VTSAASSRADERRERLRLALEESILPPLVALAIAAVVGDVLIIVFGQSPGEV
jgi:simple sugar transport system permease protein